MQDVVCQGGLHLQRVIFEASMALTTMLSSVACLLMAGSQVCAKSVAASTAINCEAHAISVDGVHKCTENVAFAINSIELQTHPISSGERVPVSSISVSS
jgi:hypothetical protein